MIYKGKEVFIEIVKDHIDGIVVSSDTREATKEDIQISEDLHKIGECPHNVVYDEDCWPYYIRVCATCGSGLGTV